MTQSEFHAKPVEPCRICSAPAPFFGSVDFNKNCEARRGLALPEAGIAVAYHRCSRCGFLFTASFAKWGTNDFAREIYNNEYILVDPDYHETRPRGNAAMMAQFFNADRGNLSVLDYGGGNGVLADTLIRDGFQAAATYDPFVPDFSHMPGRRFPVVSCFETLEHAPDPCSEIASIAGCLEDDGMVVFSTLLQPDGFAAVGLAWWYAAPRNGHISLFSKQSLTEAWGKEGFRVGSLNGDLHFAWRGYPRFAQHLIAAVSAPGT